MHIFGLAFVLYYLKLSDGNGFWLNYRQSDEMSYKQAVKVQRLQKKLLRCELAIKFLTKCRDANVKLHKMEECQRKKRKRSQQIPQESSPR